MICSRCNKKEATLHYKTVTNGKVSELHLCSECARELGFGDKYTELFSDGMTMNSILNQFFNLSSKAPQIVNAIKCEECGMDYGQFNSTGLLGCPKCYDVFADAVENMLQRTQGSTMHNGKISGPESEEIKKQNDIANLKTQLQKAILEEKYEDAAKLRDQIRELEKGEEQNG